MGWAYWVSLGGVRWYRASYSQSLKISLGSKYVVKFVRWIVDKSKEREKCEVFRKGGRWGLKRGRILRKWTSGGRRWWKLWRRTRRARRNVGMCGDTTQGDRDSFENQNNNTFYLLVWYWALKFKRKMGKCWETNGFASWLTNKLQHHFERIGFLVPQGNATILNQVWANFQQ